MIDWIVLGAATFTAVLLVLWPAIRGVRPPPPREAHDAALYRAQLAELDRDRAEGRLSDREHRDAVLEVQRRLLAAVPAPPETPAKAETPAAARWLIGGIAAVLPALALALYLPRGMPGMPAFPHAEVQAVRQAERAETDALLAQVRARIATLPPDSEDARRGWALIANVERRRGNAAGAVEAGRRALAIRFEPGLAIDLAETLAIASDGRVTAEARRLLERARAAAPDDVRARYYLALADLQAGDTEAAIAGFRAVERLSPPDASWRPMLAERIAEAETRARAQAAPGPTAEQMAAAAELPPDQRAAMIEGMVTRLAERLRETPNDAEGWLRLARAYRVMGRTTDARAALNRAAELLPDDPRVVAEKMALGAGG
ncbi:c-type cytochrome biogenesis protein CcmI [Elioraea tepidiphila]|jgi:cytochrome c-type biogenesis protein CcmH|uniref:c-type cytochrome biogenesis protein CcmI n=1 Tax=Elioraea tepidiphila TaxID=457934 RepID=UPI00035E64AA|nr:c-type cytochrome biogenesis protein CcmI [Elioraea tepidiphila]